VILPDIKSLRVSKSAPLAVKMAKKIAEFELYITLILFTR
jgi:hypothetical protein